jgi:thiamine biosynthesis lipoprotein ApbE
VESTGGATDAEPGHRPAAGLLSATVIARSATVAGSLTTLFVLGPAAAAPLRDHYRNVEAVLVLPGTGNVGPDSSDKA